MKRCILISLLYVCLASGCKEPSTQLTVATASNMQFAMKELMAAFQEQTGIRCQLVVNSSGMLTAQIRQGAPYDVFVSADMKYPMELYNKGLAREMPKVYAYGQLVLWTMTLDTVPAMALLATPAVRHIAIANPKTAPYGEAALRVLRYYQMIPTVEKKLVFGESISQTNQFILSGAADVGFTAKAVVRSPQMQGKGSWVDVDVDAYEPIAQGIVLIDHENSASLEAQEFYNFMTSPQAREILSDYGYFY